MTKRRQDAKPHRLFLSNYRNFTLYCGVAFITFAVMCYVYIQTITLERKMSEHSSWFYNGFFKSNFMDNARERKQILLWTNYFSLTGNWLPSTHELQCPVPECDVTSDRDLLPNSSAIIMHWRNVDGADLPPECPEDNDSSSSRCPVLVMFNKEAPPNTGADNVRKLNNRIHVMATYRRDSEVYAPYGKIAWRSDSFKLPNLTSTGGPSGAMNVKDARVWEWTNRWRHHTDPFLGSRVMLT